MSDIVKRLRAEVTENRRYEVTGTLALEAADRIEQLEAALRPFAGMFLYPDDLGFEASSDIKEDLDWDDDANDMNTENVFVLRRDIRRARAALRRSDD